MNYSYWKAADEGSTITLVKYLGIKKMDFPLRKSSTFQIFSYP